MTNIIVTPLITWTNKHPFYRDELYKIHYAEFHNRPVAVRIEKVFPYRVVAYNWIDKSWSLERRRLTLKGALKLKDYYLNDYMRNK